MKLATVPAIHTNSVAPAFLNKALAEALQANGLLAYVGPPVGYVLTFTNGLVVYLSGDTGITAEQDVVVRRHYNAKLAVINIGDVFTTGPTEAAYVINDLVQPASAIASHANEVATKGGKVVAGNATEAFIKADARSGACSAQRRDDDVRRHRQVRLRLLSPALQNVW